MLLANSCGRRLSGAVPLSATAHPCLSWRWHERKSWAVGANPVSTSRGSTTLGLGASCWPHGLHPSGGRGVRHGQAAPGMTRASSQALFCLCHPCTDFRFSGHECAPLPLAPPRSGQQLRWRSESHCPHRRRRRHLPQASALQLPQPDADMYSRSACVSWTTTTMTLPARVHSRFGRPLPATHPLAHCPSTIESPSSISSILRIAIRFSESPSRRQRVFSTIFHGAQDCAMRESANGWKKRAHSRGESASEVRAAQKTRLQHTA